MSSRPSWCSCRHWSTNARLMLSAVFISASLCATTWGRAERGGRLSGGEGGGCGGAELSTGRRGDEMGGGRWGSVRRGRVTPAWR